MNNEINQLVDNLFRHKSGQITSTLCRVFGGEHFELVENMVQEALLKAMRSWSFSGIPDNPEGWLYITAKNLALDYLRRESTWEKKRKLLEVELQVFKEEPNEIELQVFEDDQLKMMFMCCHPELSGEVQVALILKSLCGFHASEIAQAFLQKTTTIEQRLVRAKKKIISEKLSMELPAKELEERIEVVLNSLYLLFNEGYSASHGEKLLRRDLCLESIRLTEVFSRHELGRRPEVYALLALLHLQYSRFDSRQGSSGELILLEDQDRSLWDQASLLKGFSYLELAMQGERISSFHIEAGIAACHASAPSFEEIDWESIADYYEVLIELRPSSITRLNRAVAVGMQKGVKIGIDELLQLGEENSLAQYYLYPLALAEFYRRDGQVNQAQLNYQKALELVSNAAERAYLESKLESLLDCNKSQ